MQIMHTYFLSHDFSLNDLPDGVDQYHYDNFEDALRQRDITDDARQNARYLQHELGPDPRGADKRRLQNAWIRYHAEREQYEAMVQGAGEQLTDDYPYGFDH